MTGMRKICEIDSTPWTRRVFSIAVSEAITQAIPYEVVRRGRFLKFDFTLPRSLSSGSGNRHVRVSQDAIFGIQNFGGQLSRARTRQIVRNCHMYRAVRIGDGDRFAVCGLGAFVRLDDYDRGNSQECGEKEKPE